MKGKGKAVADYEYAAPHASANKKTLASSDEAIGKSPMPSNEKDIFAASGSVLGTAAPVPKSILRRPSSAPFETSPAGASG